MGSTSPLCPPLGLAVEPLYWARCLLGKVHVTRMFLCKQVLSEDATFSSPARSQWEVQHGLGQWEICRSCVHRCDPRYCNEPRLTERLLSLSMPLALAPFRFRIHPGQTRLAAQQYSDYGEGMLAIQNPAAYNCVARS